MAGYECLRSNDQIDYRPLNLNIILHESDITYNLALCCLAMENNEDFKSFVNSALETAQVCFLMVHKLWTILIRFCDCWLHQF